MKTQRIIQLLFLSLFLLNSYAQELKDFNAKDYSVKYPEDWTFDTSGQMNTSFIIFSKLEQNDTFRENVNLMIQDLSGMSLDLKGYAELSLGQIKSIKDSKILESKNLKKDALPYHEIVWKGFVTGKKLKFKQLYFVKNNKAYLVTLTCDETAYDRYEKIGTTILNSFIVK